MQFQADQSKRLNEFMEKWSKDNKLELEATFGPKGVVDSTTFLSISQYLRNKGFEAIPQDDRLSILTPNQIRLSLQGLGVLQSYCKDDTLQGKAFTAMIKDRAFEESNLDLEEYDIRFKVRREEELSDTDPRVLSLVASSHWQRLPKAFRLIRRWSFTRKGIRVDMSVVRQTATNPQTGQFLRTLRFQDQHLFQQLPRYEVEVELLHATDDTTTPEKALKTLISGVGEVQRAIQHNNLLIRKSIAQQTLREYAEVVGTESFRGVNPVTLEVKNMIKDIDPVVPNIRNGFNVTDKADGLRAMGFVTKDGELFLIDMSMKVYRTGLHNPTCALSLLDGEWVTQTKEKEQINQYLVFDIYYSPDAEKEFNKPFVSYSENGSLEDCRYRSLQEWFKKWNEKESIIAKGITVSNRLHLIQKHFEFATPQNDSIFIACSRILQNPKPYHTDGLILTSNDHPIPERAGRWDFQFKWKPAIDNTVDFLINYERDIDLPSNDKISITFDPSNDQTIQYKTMRLFVGGTRGVTSMESPRDTILLQRPLPSKSVGPSYQPILFLPTDFPDTMANTCNVLIQMDPMGDKYCMTEDSKEPIPDRSIVEMRYDPTKEPGWRWIPSRIRHDKTERLQRSVAKERGKKYSSTMNDERTANSVWNSIHDPVTLSMITTGKEEPLEQEIKNLLVTRETDITKKYYERKASKQDINLIKGLRDFHNQYIKNDILLQPTLRGGNKRLLDVSCGKGGDLFKWINDGAQYVLGVDIAQDNILNPSDGAYKRYLEALVERGPERVPRMAFVIGNSSKRLIDGEAGATPEDRDMLRSIFGKYPPESYVPPYIEHVMKDTYQSGADVTACMFALHYFFENNTILNGFLQNLADTIKVGGYFIGCCFDGDAVFNLLRRVEQGHSISGKEGDTPIWTITKEYSNEDLTPDDNSIGLAIDVEFISIGSTHREYLVPFELLINKLATIGLRLLDSQELAELGLRSSTNMFETSYKMAQQSGHRYFMTEPVQEYSFLNRWFIFKRAGETFADISAKRFGQDITQYNKNYEKFNIVSSSSYSVLKPWHKEQVKEILTSWFPVDSVKFIVDATAHIGVDTIHMSNLFPRAIIDAFEIVPETFQKLRNNIRTFHKEQVIRPHNEDVTLWQPTHVVDFLYVDPPWGGVHYGKQETMDLYLQKEKNEQNETKNVNALIDKWIQSGKIRNIVLKAPKNFDKTYLMTHYEVDEKTVLNLAKRIAFTLIRIQAPSISLDINEQVPPNYSPHTPEGSPPRPLSYSPHTPEGSPPRSPEGPPLDTEEEKKDDLVARLPSSDRKFALKEIFSFGMDIDAIPNNVSVKNEKGENDKHMARWLSLSAPFPIPDPDDSSIVYPSIEHYMGAMKLKHASNRPELAKLLMSTDGSIHQFYQNMRRARSVKPESTADFKLLAEEITEVRKKTTKTSLQTFKAKVDEDKWLLEKDNELRNALEYRWKHDKRFHDIVESARQAGKYLLYQTTVRASSSELGGKRSATTGQIQGENKVGRIIMELAGFQF